MQNLTLPGNILYREEMISWLNSGMLPQVTLSLNLQDIKVALVMSISLPTLSTLFPEAVTGSVRVWSVDGKKELVALIFLNENDWFIKNPDGYLMQARGHIIQFLCKGTEIFNIGQFFNEFYRPGLYGDALSSDGPRYRQNLARTIEKYPPTIGRNDIA